MRAALALLVLTACASAPEHAARPQPTASASAAPSRPPAPVEIVVTERPGADRWHVKYTFAEPVRGIAFDRSSNKFRASSWRATSGGKDLSWKVIEGREAILIDDPKGSNAIELAFESNSDDLHAEYELNVDFSEGSHLLYTGHFGVRVLGCPKEACEPNELVATKPTSEHGVHWTFRTDPGRGIVTTSSKGLGELEWAPSGRVASQGTYVYFGALVPIDTKFGRVILDPGLPGWMRRSAEEAIPKIFDFYATELRTPLPKQPLVTLSFAGAAEKGRGTGGGVLPGVMQVGAFGAEWLAESPEARVHWMRTLAHEAFHLWNGDLFMPKSSGDTWLSEGVADYFAQRGLVALSVSDERRYGDSLIGAANRCLLTSPHGLPLRGHRLGGPEYACGMTLFSLIDRSARANQSSGGLVLADVFAKAAASGSAQYGSDDVLEAAARAGVDPATTLMIGAILKVGLPPDTDSLFAERLRAMGIAVDRVPLSAAGVTGDELLSITGIEMAACDCKQRISFNYKADEALLDFLDASECKVPPRRPRRGGRGQAAHRAYSGAQGARRTEEHQADHVQARGRGQAREARLPRGHAAALQAVVASR